VSELSTLDLAAWRPTRDRLHRWARLAGSVRRQRSPYRKHWWHIGLLPAARGLTTGPFGIPGGAAEISLDLVAGELALQADDGRETRLALALDPATDGFAGLRAGLVELGAEVEMMGFGEPTPGAYDAAAARCYLRVLSAVGCALRAVQAELPGEASPIQLWPHGFDVAMTWLSGRLIPGQERVEDPEQRDETVTVGFSTGDANDPYPYLYAIAHPWPAAAKERVPEVGRWHASGWNGIVMPWAEVVASGDAITQVTSFARSAWMHLAGAQGALMVRARTG
jgi:hypothetical protein